jgi:hypothetical protein
MAIQEKSLATCTLKYLDKTFGTRQVRTLAALDNWLSRTADISDLERQILLRFQTFLDFNVHDWNEHELDSHFIGPVFALADFSTRDFNHFSQRELSATVNDILLYGRVDGMVASGWREPELPFFAFQEYKRNLDPNGDPAGQVLAAMLAGQALNNGAFPIYGCYVVGRDWYFLALDNLDYATTKGHNALDAEELFDIFRILKALKQIVAERVGQL